MIIIASRHVPGMREVHDRSWAVMRGWLSDIQCLGEPPTIGLVEALLLLAENLPRDPRPQRFGEEIHGAENRQAWMLIGTAVRSAYSLGIDKVSHGLCFANGSLRSNSSPRWNVLSSSNGPALLGPVSLYCGLAYVDCYLFDRQ